MQQQAQAGQQQWAGAQQQPQQGTSRELSTCSSQECRRGCHRGCRRNAGHAGAPGGAPGAPNPNPPIRTTGFWIFKKKFCTQCEQQLDKTWDACPYCAQIAAQAAAAPAKLQKLKTQAFVLDSTGGPGSMQLLGWLVPLQGPQRGELFTLSPTTVDRHDDPSARSCLNDKFMSSKHAEIKAENGMWILRDTGLDQRHLRQQPARRSPRARRQRLHQVRLARCEVQEPMKRVLLLFFVALFALDATSGARR